MAQHSAHFLDKGIYYSGLCISHALNHSLLQGFPVYSREAGVYILQLRASCGRQWKQFVEVPGIGCVQ